jgi:hypothetical protein
MGFYYVIKMEYLQKTVSLNWNWNSSMSRCNNSREKKSSAPMTQYYALIYLYSIHIVHMCKFGVIISEETTSNTENTNF